MNGELMNRLKTMWQWRLSICLSYSRTAKHQSPSIPVSHQILALSFYFLARAIMTITRTRGRHMIYSLLTYCRVSVAKL